MMNADCLQCDRLIRLQWDGVSTRGNAMQPLVWEEQKEEGRKRKWGQQKGKKDGAKIRIKSRFIHGSEGK